LILYIIATVFGFAGYALAEEDKYGSWSLGETVLTQFWAHIWANPAFWNDCTSKKRIAGAIFQLAMCAVFSAAYCSSVPFIIKFDEITLSESRCLKLLKC